MVYIYMCTYIHMYLHMYTHMYIHVYIYISYMQAYVHIHGVSKVIGGPPKFCERCSWKFLLHFRCQALQHPFVNDEDAGNLRGLPWRSGETSDIYLCFFIFYFLMDFFWDFNGILCNGISWDFNGIGPLVNWHSCGKSPFFKGNSPICMVHFQ